MPKERSWDAPLRQMSLRLVNEPQPIMSETMRDEIIFAMATLLLDVAHDVANSDDVAKGVIKDEQ